MRSVLKYRSTYFDNLKNSANQKEKKFVVSSKINKKLCYLNLRTPIENTPKSIQITLESIILGLAYFSIVYAIFSQIWYLKTFTFISTAMFMKIYLDVRLELMAMRINKDLPKMIRKVTHYLISTEGNMIKALEKAELAVPVSTRVYITKTLIALKSDAPDLQIEALKTKTHSRWTRMFYDMTLYGKKYGDKTAEENRIISQNLKKITQITSYINLKRGYDNVELLWMEVFTFFLPTIVIPITQQYYAIVHADMGGSAIYQSLDAQNLAAQIFFLANLATLFIDWLRKDS